MKWDIDLCKNKFWYGFERDTTAKDGKERLHTSVVRDGVMYCNNLRKDGADPSTQAGFFSVPFEKVWKLKKTKDKKRVQFLCNGKHRCSFWTKITRVFQVTPKDDLGSDSDMEREDRQEYLEKVSHIGKNV